MLSVENLYRFELCGVVFQGKWKGDGVSEEIYIGLEVTWEPSRRRFLRLVFTDGAAGF